MRPKPRTPLVLLAAFAALLLTHLPLLGLPYYWDEAGYFVPAARDIYADGRLVPRSTLSNAHPPLVMAYLALAWKLFGFGITVARAAMLGVAALALAGLYALGWRVANGRVALGAVACTALYPVFFAQSSLVHLDMAVAALTLWALVFYVPPRAATSPREEAGLTQRGAGPLQRDSKPSPGDAEGLQAGAEALQGDAKALHRDAEALQDDTKALQDDTKALQHDAKVLRRGIKGLRCDEKGLRRDVKSLQSDVKGLQSEAKSLQDSAEDLQGGAEGLQDSAKPSRDGAEGRFSAGNAGFRRVVCVLLLALAVMAKETAVLVPFVLCGWELACYASRRRARLAALVCLGRRPAWWSLALLLACAPLALWLAYHRSRTGYLFGNPEYFRYNVEATLNLPRVLDAAWRRLGHVTAHMNLWALTLAGIAAMFLKPRRERGVERPRIAAPVQLLFAALVAAHVVALSLVGGAVLARYMLPVLPLVVLVWVSTLWRRVPAWPLAVALVCAAFLYRAEVNPPYSFPWEENLAYRDFVLLHRDAARFLEEKHADARVLTTWPATDELRNPYYGYAGRAFRVLPVENFLPETLKQAAQRKSEYDVALLYSTHGGAGLEEAARLLGGRVVFRGEREGQWVAVLDARGGE